MQSFSYHLLKGYLDTELIIGSLPFTALLDFIAKDLPMQAKHLIIIAIIGIAALAAFNIFNKPSVAPATAIVPATETPATSTSIADQPLSQQPKAIVDKATTDIAAAQQLQNAKIATADAQ